MSFDADQLMQAVSQHQKVVRVLVAETKGSTPRETGASMLVFPNGQIGTIGGGSLEFEAAIHARKLLKYSQKSVITRVALGPDMGQCCGGAVTLLSEVFDAQSLVDLPKHGLFARPIATHATLEDTPLFIHRIINCHRSEGHIPAPEFSQGWMIEPIAAPRIPLWIYGAGHVGRALVNVLSPLPQFSITWLDVDPGRFPEISPSENATRLPAKDLPTAAKHAPEDAHHLVLTYSHETDLALCHQILSQPFSSAGLIGSRTKWARFKKRLIVLGHEENQIERISCPIGTPTHGKHPQSIAIGVTFSLLQGITAKDSSSGRTNIVGYATKQ